MRTDSKKFPPRPRRVRAWQSVGMGYLAVPGPHQLALVARVLGWCRGAAKALEDLSGSIGTGAPHPMVALRAVAHTAETVITHVARLFAPDLELAWCPAGALVPPTAPVHASTSLEGRCDRLHPTRPWSLASTMARRNDVIAAAYRAGATTGTLATRHGISGTMVRRILSARGVPLRIRRTRWTSKMGRRLRALWRTSSPKSIAGTLHVSVQTVLRRAAAHGYRTPRVPHGLSDQQRAEMRAAYTQGRSVHEIADAFGVAYQTAHSVVNDLIPHARRRMRYTHRGTLFDSLTVESAYWLGFLIADGHVDTKKKTLQVTLARRDRDHLLKLRAALRSTHPVRNRVRSGAGMLPISCLSIYAPTLVATLVTRFGFGRGKPGRARWPRGGEWTSELQAHFLRGVIDGDGSWDRPTSLRSQHRLRITGHRRLLLGIRDFLERETGVGRVSIRRNGHSRRCWVLAYGGNVSAARIAAVIYPAGTDWARSGIAMARKYRRYAGHMAAIGGGRTHRRRLSPQQIAEALERVRAGETRTAVAASYGVCRTLITYYERNPS